MIKSSLFFLFVLLLFLVCIPLQYINIHTSANADFEIYHTEIKKIELILKKDFEVYNECIKNKMSIDCGRSYSNMKKKPKILNVNQYLLFDQPNSSISENNKPCDMKDVYVIYDIQTGPDYFAERYIYRSFYSKFSNIQFFFFTGLSSNETINKMIYMENTIYKDVIIFPFISRYCTASLSFVSEMKWIMQNCFYYKWVIRHQSDVYVDVNKVTQLLTKTNCKECGIGSVIRNMPIDRRKTGLYYVPHFLLPNVRDWPTYLRGPLMIYTKEAVEIIDKQIGKVHPQYWLDDVYVGLLIQNTNIKLIEINNFSFESSISIEKANSMYAVHDLYPSELYYMTNNKNNL